MSSSNHTQDPYYLSLGYLRPLFDHLRQNQHDIGELLDILGLNEDDLGQTDLRVADSKVIALIDAAERSSQDQNIGLHAGARMSLGSIGILGHLIMTCNKASQVINLQMRYQTLIGNGGLSHYQVTGDKVVLQFTRAEGQAPYSRHVYEFNLAGWTSLVTLVAGQRIHADFVEFPCPAPADDSEQQRYFGCEVRYVGGDTMRVQFARDYLEHALIAGDPSLREQLELAARKRLAELQGAYSEHKDSSLRLTQNFVREQLAHGPPTIEQAAEAVGTSVRTLQRQLDAEGVSFKTVLDETRRELGARYIANEDLSLIDVALMLGFAEQSSFQRAFKRWYELTPGEYRRQLAAQPA